MMYMTKNFPMFMQMDYNDESAIIAIDRSNTGAQGVSSGFFNFIVYWQPN